MTDAKKPRELTAQEFHWLHLEGRKIPCSIQSTAVPCDRLIELMDMKKDYDKLLVRLERTKSAAYHALLEMSAWLGIPEHKRKAQIEYLMKNVNYCADTDISKRDNEAKNE